jgi:hypothetical protein
MTKHKEVEKWVAGLGPSNDLLQTVRATFIETPTEFIVKIDSCDCGPGSKWRTAVRLCGNRKCFRKNSNFDMRLIHNTECGAVEALRSSLTRGVSNSKIKLRDSEDRLADFEAQVKEQGYPQ